MEKRAKVIGTFIAVALVGLLLIKLFFSYGGDFLTNKAAELTQKIEEATEEIKEGLGEKSQALNVKVCENVIRLYTNRKERDELLGQVHEGMTVREKRCSDFLNAEKQKEVEAAKPAPQDDGWFGWVPGWVNPLNWF